MSAPSAAPVEPAEPGAGPTPGTRGDMPPAMLAVIVVLIGVGVTAAVLRLTGSGASGGPSVSDVDLSVPDWRPTDAERQALEAVAQARREAAPDPEEPAVKALVEAYEAFNRADVKHKGYRASPGLQDAHAEYAQRARELARSERLGGEAAYMGVGQRLSEAFMKALAAGDGDEVRRLGGTFVEEGHATGLLRPPMRPAPGALEVIRAAFMARWSSALADLKPSDTLLSTEERVLLTRWKIAANPLLDLRRRAELAAALERSGSAWPAREAVAARAADDRRFDLCGPLYRQAAERATDEDRKRRLNANAEYCETVASQRTRIER